MADTNVPVLIPQAWIQWHSLTKKYLSSNTSLHPEDIYRVDFVAFWNNKRFAIQVDDISHYAVKRDNIALRARLFTNTGRPSLLLYEY